MLWTHTQVSSATDWEGNRQVFESWLKHQSLVKRNQNGLYFTRPQTAFVYGGDFSDRGPYSLRLGRLLVDFKKQNPKDVTLIAGNRDVQTKRFIEELGENSPQNQTIRQRLLKGPQAYWIPQYISPKAYVWQHMQQTEHDSGDVETYVHKLSVLQCQTLYLQWMLKTMGCPNTFEFLREEIAEIEEVSSETIDDEAVTQKVLQEIQPGGVFRDYIEHSQIVHREGDTLYVHGAIPLVGLGFVPDIAKPIEHADEWFFELNRWYRAQVKSWIEKGPLAPKHQPAMNAMATYYMYNKRSVCTTNWYPHGRLEPIAKEVICYLNQAGIHRVITGHQPFSDFPLIIKQPGLEIIAADTGYSDHQAKDGRGCAVHSLEISFDEKGKGSVTIDAIRRDGQAQHVCLNQDAFSRLGTFDAYGRLIGINSDGEYVTLKLDGYNVIESAHYEPSLSP